MAGLGCTEVGSGTACTLLTEGGPAEDVLEDKDAEFFDFETEKLRGVSGFRGACGRWERQQELC
jgi:hypothetical protein